MTETITPPQSDDGPCSACKRPVVVWHVWLPGHATAIEERICFFCGQVESIH